MGENGCSKPVLWCLPMAVFVASMNLAQFERMIAESFTKMEQQTISVAKGGFVCSLNSRCTVFAAMNPPSGGFEQGKELAINTNIASSLLSRFDLILLLIDQKNCDWDRRVGQHLMY